MKIELNAVTRLTAADGFVDSRKGGSYTLKTPTVKELEDYIATLTKEYKDPETLSGMKREISKKLKYFKEELEKAKSKG